ncbi:MAG: lipopolysaccharide heptosyltransferase 1, partial [Magnetococcales bacterium]|nr:lipopolysaccharide heptosyltransferase 1 [Magnetococcales bacterium]
METKRLLLVKVSSLGDLLFALPALTDACQALPGIRFDWVVEKAFAEIPTWHPGIDRVIPLGLRHWRRRPISLFGPEGAWPFLRHLRERHYDQVLDAQGLLKSGIISALARGRKSGFDAPSARERSSAWFYTQRHPVPQGDHAISRVRRLFAMALGYPLPDSPPDYGLDPER